MAETIFIPRQVLTSQEMLEARRDGINLTAGKSVVQLRGICTALCQENMRMMKEANAARVALGLEPLPVYKVK